MARLLHHLTSNYPISCLYMAFIWVLCFMDVPHTPLDNITLIDKWTHILMYAGTCATIWYEYLRRHDSIVRARVFLLAWLAPLVMSGLIEILQEFGGRLIKMVSGGAPLRQELGEFFDAIGVTLGNVIGILLAAYRARKRRG